jgi:hypothetical protein
MYAKKGLIDSELLPIEDLLGESILKNKITTFDPKKCQKIIQIVKRSEPVDDLIDVEDSTSLKFKTLAQTPKPSLLEWGLTMGSTEIGAKPSSPSRIFYQFLLSTEHDQKLIMEGLISDKDAETSHEETEITEGEEYQIKRKMMMIYQQ